VLVGKKLPVVVNWLETCARVGGEKDDTLKMLIALKTQMVDVKTKAEEIGVTLFGDVEVGVGDEESDESEDVFEDVTRSQSVKADSKGHDDASGIYMSFIS